MSIVSGQSWGWFYPVSGRRGAILCGPNGYEALCSHRQWTRLASELAEAGIPTLRFDYPGCGDALDDDEMPERVRAWLDGIHDAVAFMRQQSGIEEIALIGLRLGGILALAAAQELARRNKAVDALVLLAAPASGAAYVKELRMLSMMAKARRPDAASDAPGIEAAGFHYTPETIAELKSLNPVAEDIVPAQSVLVLDREDSVSGLADQFRKKGIAVTSAPFAGYARLMNDAALSQYPTEDFDRIVDWLRPEETLTKRIAPPSGTHVIGIPRGTETPIWIEGATPLFGVFSEPTQAAPHRSAVLILNTGANHHIGTNRMSVSIARRLIAEGIAVLRIDAGGVGESPSVPGRPDNAFAREDMIADARRAVDWLAGRGYQDITLNGLCSGAWLCFQTALAEPRVTGQILLNLQGLWQSASLARTMESNRKYLRLLRQARTWRRLFKGEIDVKGIAVVLSLRLREAVLVGTKRVFGGFAGTETIERKTKRQMKALAARGVNTSFVYVAADRGLDELELHFGRLGEALHAEANVHFTIIEEGDHLFSMKRSRDRLIELMATQFSAGRFVPTHTIKKDSQSQRSSVSRQESMISRVAINDQ
ncbi:MAG TPA: alpha/beta fold hydrolase [Dongiaceae bacterium]